jgi:hypothetical protein
MRIVRYWQWLTKGQRNRVVTLDQQYLDSDLSVTQIHENHQQRRDNEEFAYFVSGGRLYGYCIYLRENWLRNYVYIYWFVAPKHGKACFRKLLSSKFVRNSLVRLYASKTPPKGYLARVNLYKSEGFRTEVDTAHGTVMVMSTPFGMRVLKKRGNDS